MLSNPPYGKSWKSDLNRLGGKNDIKDPRFVTQHGGNQEYKMITRSSDGQLMFLVNKLSKMKASGSRIAEVHNGSSLFTGDAGQGESEIRRWIIENDWLEAIVALPQNIFYNTGIATYIWLLTNRKSEERKGKVQLIDASEWFEPLRRNLGKRNCELSKEQMRTICDLIVKPVETEKSKIFSNDAFGYWKITVERPLRLAVDLSSPRLHQFEKICEKKRQKPLAELVRQVAQRLGEGPHLDFNAFINACEAQTGSSGIKLNATHKKLLRAELCDVKENAEPVVKKAYKPGKANPDPFHGRFEVQTGGKSCVVEYEPDTALRDSEQVPFLEEGGVEAFFRREVLPFTQDAWIDVSKTAIGYEISFTRHFYRPVPMRTLDEIKRDINALERETDGLLKQIVGESE